MSQYNSDAWREKVKTKETLLDKIRTTNPEAYDRMVISTLLSNAKKRAGKTGINFTLQRSDIPLRHVCPVLGIRLELHAGKQANNSYSLDRLNSDLGYVAGNIGVISWRANYLKQELTLEQARNLVKYMEGS